MVMNFSRTQLLWTTRIAILLLFHLAVNNCIRSPVFSNSDPGSPARTLFNFTEFIHGRTLYIFGDSTVAAGDFLKMKYPYGVDLRQGSPPPFSNRYTIADYIAIRMGSPIPPAYEKGRIFSSSGVNFASERCGILTRKPIEYCSFSGQLLYLLRLVRLDSAGFDRSLFLLSLGSDDYISYDGEETDHYTEELVTEFVYFIEILYGMGARTFLINNVGPLGCIPDKRDRDNSTKNCDERLNMRVQLYNLSLELALLKFMKKFKEATVILADSYKLFKQMMKDPSKFGFEVIDSPCCGEWAPDKNMYQCKEETTEFCNDRSRYLFFDGSHTTDEANRIFVESCFSGIACNQLVG